MAHNRTIKDDLVLLRGTNDMENHTKKAIIDIKCRRNEK